jgi:Protein of unknown function (DUF3102)
MMQETSIGIVNRDPTQNYRFEYETLPSDKRAAIQQLTTEIKKELQKTAHIIWEIGKKLAEVRSQIETCGFNSWLKTEFNWSRRTAYKLISVYEAFPEFSRAQYAQLDISASALYLLAAPSTHPQIRSHFLELALAGNNISHQSVRAFINEFKEIPTDRDRLDPSRILAANGFKDAVIIESQPSMLADPIRDLSESEAQVIGKNSDLEEIEQASTTETSAVPDLRPAWNAIAPGFSLFWGSTTSPRFIECLPEDAFILAVPTCKWHYDWLLNQSRSCINLTQSKPDKELVMKLLSALSLGEKAVVFPWVPNWKLVKLTLQLDLKIYAGDPDLNKCEETIAKLGFNQLTRR